MSNPHPYRAQEGNPRERVERLRAETDRLAARLTPRYWERLSSEVRGLRDQLARAETPDDEDGWEERLRELMRYRDELTHAVDQAPELEAQLRALPRSVGQRALGKAWPEREGVVLMAKEWSEDPGRAYSLATRIAAWIGELDPEAEIVERGGDVRVAPFRAEGVPFALEAVASSVSEDLQITLATSAPEGLGELELVPKQWLHDLATRLRLDRDALTGDPVFDERFMVRGESRLARQLLSEALRDDLLTMARDAPLELRVEPGLAWLRWHYMLSRMHLVRAMRLLGELRHAPLSVALLR